MIWLLSFAFVALLCPLVAKGARHFGFVDVPGARRVHAGTIPRLGGLAIALGVMGALLFQKIHLDSKLFVGGGLALCVGILDDTLSLGARRKLLLQVLIGLIIFFMGLRFETISIGPGYQWSLGWFSLPFTVLWFAAIMNAVNLIDGIDGLAAGTSGISFGALMVFAWISGNNEVLTLAGCGLAACLAFLIYNFHPASIFMGDSGSMFLGFVLAYLGARIVGTSGAALPLHSILLVLAFPILDTSIAIVRRTIRLFDWERLFPESRQSGRPGGRVLREVFSADGDHIHHRMIRQGWSQRKTALILYGFSAVSSGTALLILAFPPPLSWLFGVLIVFITWHFVMSLGYNEFAPRSVRLETQRFELEDSIGKRESVVKKVSAPPEDRN